MGFGNLASICELAPLPLCPLIGHNAITNATGTQPHCYARTITLANTIIFEGAAATVHIVALIMTTIMLLHVRSKFTAVGRKEITSFFYLYMLLTVFSLVLDAGVVSPGSGALPYFVAIQIGLAGATCLSLLINGFVGFQIYEDGTSLSVWMLRLCSLAWFLISFVVALLTFKGWAGPNPGNAIGLFVIMYIFNALFLVVYAIMQLVLVLSTLQDRWPLGDIFFGVFFFVAGQVIMYAVGETICEQGQHYVDGLFFASVCNLLAVMMVYKYWDSITKEDLEFSVGTKVGNWEVGSGNAQTMAQQSQPLMQSGHASMSQEQFGLGKIGEYRDQSARESTAFRDSYIGKDYSAPKQRGSVHNTPNGRNESRERSTVGYEESSKRISRQGNGKDMAVSQQELHSNHPALRDSGYDRSESSGRTR